MRQLIKYFLWIGALALGLQSAWAFSLLGPVANGGDAWQVPLIGFNPLPGDSLPTGPKNLGEGYRRNAPVMYYAFDPSFADFFGTNGEGAVAQAFELVNGVMNGQTNSPLLVYDTANPRSPTNGFLMAAPNGVFNVPLGLNPAKGIDSYTADLSEFPLNTEFPGNSSAVALRLLDMKSFTLWALMEQMGLADAIRYTWVLHDRYLPSGATCTAPGNVGGGTTNVNGVEYIVVQRNFYIAPTALNLLQYTNYINGVLYDYVISENCGAAGISPPDADALAVPVSGAGGPPVSSGIPVTSYFTGLTRDDAGGLRWLYSTNNYDTPSAGYRESPAAGSALFNYGLPQLLFTSNYNALVATSLTNNPATLQGLFPGLQFTLVTNYFSNVVSSSMIFVTNFPVGGIPGQGYVGLQTVYATNIVEFFQYAFGNVVTNKFYPTTTYQLQTVTVGPPIGSPVTSPFATNVSLSQPFQSNVVSGDYFVIANGACPPTFLQTLQTNVNVVTNTLAATINANGSSIVQNLVSYFTNYAFVVQPCTLQTNTPADYQGVGRVQFIQVRDDNFDYQNGQFITPITNQYTMTLLANGRWVTQTFQRVVNTPDFLFAAADQLFGPAALPVGNTFSRNVNFNQADIQTGLAGPGTIDPSSVLTYDKAGPVYFNFASTNGGFPNGISPSTNIFFVWGSFDGTTNLPVVYPNGTSLTNLAASALIQISPAPPALPNGTKGSPYNVAFTATGTSGPVTWTLAPQSAGLPPGLVLTNSPTGAITGTPTQSGTFNYIDIQVTDSGTPPHIVQTIYSLTIN
jgi:hypothetical protein